MSNLAVPQRTDTPKPRKLATADDVADRLNLPKSTVYELGRRGRIPGVIRLGRTMRFDLDRLELWIQQGSGG